MIKPSWSVTSVSRAKYATVVRKLDVWKLIPVRREARFKKKELRMAAVYDRARRADIRVLRVVMDPVSYSDAGNAFSTRVGAWYGVFLGDELLPTAFPQLFSRRSKAVAVSKHYRELNPVVRRVYVQVEELR